jgi:hypothetical protein
VDAVEDKSKAREMLTSGTGFNWLASEINNAALLFYPKMDHESYKALCAETARKPKCYDLVIFLQDGRTIIDASRTGMMKGFSISGQSVGMMVPKLGADIAKSQQFYCFFSESLALENAEVLDTDIDPANLRALYQPDGVKLDALAVSPTDGITFKVTDRTSGDPVLDLVEADFEIISKYTNAAIEGATFADDTNGVYSFTPTNSPADNFTEVYTARIKKTVDSVVTLVSNIVNIKPY